MSTAPALRSISTEKASHLAVSEANAGDPAATVSPATIYESLTVNGMPSSGGGRPDCRRRSDSAASVNASGLATTIEFSPSVPLS